MHLRWVNDLTTTKSDERKIGKLLKIYFLNEFYIKDSLFCYGYPYSLTFSLIKNVTFFTIFCIFQFLIKVIEFDNFITLIVITSSSFTCVLQKIRKTPFDGYHVDHQV